MTERRKLTDILHDSGERERLAEKWGSTEAAEELAPLPKGEYLFRIISGELSTSRSNGTPGYAITLEVAEGELEGRRCWHTFWLTEAALPLSKRDLAKIGVRELSQLEQPLPAGILIRGRVSVRRDDNDNEYNRLVRFEFAGIEKGDAFEPDDFDAEATEFKPNDFESNGTPPRPNLFDSTPSTNGAYDREGERP